MTKGAEERGPKAKPKAARYGEQWEGAEEDGAEG